MATRLNPLLISRRLLHYKFTRTQLPPLQEPKESPYIVGPYLKPVYEPVKYITDPIKHRDDNDLNHFIYEREPVEYDESRTVPLILIQDVEGLGVAGQVVQAPYRYGASKLIAMRKAEYATEHTYKWYKSGPKTLQSASSALSPRTSRFLKIRIFDLPIPEDVIVKPWHLSLALRLSDCICPTSAIDETSIGEYLDEQDQTQVKCTVRINDHERVEVKFKYSRIKKED